MKSETKVIIFSGPTLSKKDIQNRMNAIVLGPVSQGDVLKAYKKYHPTHIGIIDGYYENVPSVWHKEILFVMSQGVHVYGAASMGALRSAELHAFGMKGVGKIFEMYRSGDIEDDDEVAVLHGPEELGFPALTEAMINIRLTLERAETEKVLSSNIAKGGIDFIKSLFYKKRNQQALIDYLSDYLDSDGIGAFQIWFGSNYVNQKYTDAYELVSILERVVKEDPSINSVNYSFYKTSFFRKMFTEIEGAGC